MAVCVVCTDLATTSRHDKVSGYDSVINSLQSRQQGRTSSGCNYYRILDLLAIYQLIHSVRHLGRSHSVLRKTRATILNYTCLNNCSINATQLFTSQHYFTTPNYNKSQLSLHHG